MSAIVLLVAACGGAPTTSTMTARPLVMQVSGNRLVDGSGTTLQLRGVNRAGTEYACIQGWGIFDGPSGANSVSAMQSWKINSVRVPLNEDCWLGINGVSPDYSGSNYRTALKNYVSLLHQHGMYVILDLHGNAPGGYQARAFQAMPDADHTPDFWSSVASTFTTDPAVAFELFNEPHLGGGNNNDATEDQWACWLRGCQVSDIEIDSTTVPGTWRAAGMQSLVDAIRGTGADQPILLDGLQWASAFNGLLTHLPRDPLNRMVAVYHLYQGHGCEDQSCWQSDILQPADRLPVIVDELGERKGDCSETFIDDFMPWADHQNVSYLAWAWNAGDKKYWSCNQSALIESYDGTPTPYGHGLQQHLRSLN
jgi:endoglucanase